MCNLWSESGISIITCDLLMFICCYALQEAFWNSLSVLFLSHLPPFSHRHTNIYSNYEKMRLLQLWEAFGNFQPMVWCENIEPQQQFGHENKGVSMVRQKLWISIPKTATAGNLWSFVLSVAQGMHPWKPQNAPSSSVEKRSTNHKCYKKLFWKK